MAIVKKTGRLSSLLYLIASIPGLFALLYVPGKLFVKGNPAATFHNIAASETLFRLGIFADVAGQTLFLLVALSLYQLLKEVNQRHALLMLILIVVSVPIAFANELNSVAALILARGADFLSVFNEPQRIALMRLFLNLRGAGFDVAGIFWGLWLSAWPSRIPLELYPALSWHHAHGCPIGHQGSSRQQSYVFHEA